LVIEHWSLIRHSNFDISHSPIMPKAKLTRSFFHQAPVKLARALLGKTLVRVLDDGTRLAGRIVETEAYLGVEDLAAHSVGGRRTQRNASMYLDGGCAYVYFTYGMHYCFNIVAERTDQPTAALIRALEPTEGLGTMRQNRAGKIPADRLRDTDLCSGPAKLCQAMAIDRDLDGVDMVTDARLFLERAAPIKPDHIVASPRIGVAYAKQWADKPLRFFVRDHSHVSRRV